MKLAYTCDQCGNTFFDWPSNRLSKNKFCDRACMDASYPTPLELKMHPEGYVLIYCPDHPRTMAGGYVLEHILVVEKAIGSYLPVKAQVHHWNEDRTDNRPDNLLVCPDLAYHKLIHRRMRIKAMGGDPNKDQYCRDCKACKPSSEFRGISSNCRPCHAKYEYRRKHAGRTAA